MSVSPDIDGGATELGGPDRILTASDPFAATLALDAPPLLRRFNRAGVLAAADVHVALTLGRLARVTDTPSGEPLLLAVALAVRAPRLGHVFVDLASVAATAAVESEETVDLASLPWPEPGEWVAQVAAAGSLVGLADTGKGPAAGTGTGARTGAAGAPDPVRPLRLAGTRLYLDRYWREERTLASRLLSFAGAPMRPVPAQWLSEALGRLFPGEADPLQRTATAICALRGLAVIAGGPGTGKTTTVARVCALLHEHAAAAGAPPPLIALCAPTGKAAARLGEAVHQEAGRMAVAPEVRQALTELRASTIHRLLGWRGDSHSRFRHDASNPLPHDVVIVDEASMVALTLMARLAEAVRTDARLVLVGDPDQLTAIEAGAVLRDIVGPAAETLQLSRPMRALLDLSIGDAEFETSLPAGTGASHGFGDGVVVLRRGHRFGAGIERLADAVRRGDTEAAVDLARSLPEEIDWIEVDPDPGAVADPRSEGDPDPGAVADPRSEGALAELRDRVVTHWGAVRRAALAGDAGAALTALANFRLLCAHRAGPYGVRTWTATVERWLADADPALLPGTERDYVGRPLLITHNDYELGLLNGDAGVLVRTQEGRTLAAFERNREIVRFTPSRLAAVDTVHAMTVHKSQGSQFAVAAVVLPEPRSRILTRELLYTAVTRARDRLLLIGSEASLRAAIDRPVARATGLRDLLWERDRESR